MQNDTVMDLLTKALTTQYADIMNVTILGISIEICFQNHLNK